MSVAAPGPDLMVISPHLDDAVLSLGAFLARAARTGLRTAILTVFAGKLDSRAPAGGWDRRGGFATEGEASTARRLEDQAACRLVGAEPSWLAFSEADYREFLDADAIWSTVTDEVARARAADVLLPGYPLTNPDHAWLARLLVERGVPCRRLGLYADQPYRYLVRRDRWWPEASSFLPSSLREGATWTRAGGGIADVWKKRCAIRAYRSQMPLLGFSAHYYWKLNRMLLQETLRGGEAIMWLSGS